MNPKTKRKKGFPGYFQVKDILRKLQVVSCIKNQGYLMAECRVGMQRGLQSSISKEHDYTGH